jgi:Uncharacterised protein family (UPF0236)
VNAEPGPITAPDAFAAARAEFEQVIEFTRRAAVDEITHGQLERELSVRMREVTRRLFQDHLDLREVREKRATVVADAEGIERNRIERHRRTGLDTVFGPVALHRTAYRGDYVHDLHLLDAHLNLPGVKASHGLARLAVLEAVRGSFAAATEHLRTSCGVKIGPRQVQDLVVHSACDIASFYAAMVPTPAGPQTLLVLTFDGKGIVMRPEALREATAKAAAKKGANTYKTRLASGEKNGRKRMAEIAAVYDADPAPRTAADVLPEPDEHRERAEGPSAFNKWLTGSVELPAAATVKAAFTQAHARDPHHARAWIVLVDGAAHQIDLVKAEAKRRKVHVEIVVDFIHVLEYLWKAAWCLYKSGDPEAEAFVAAYGREILAGRAPAAAAQLEGAAREAGLEPGQRTGIDDAIGYLTGKAPYLAYDKALANGYPIATGVIEGACRHLIKDRLDITGARWSLDGAEAVLRLRALRSSGDFEAYWAYHEARDYQRNHLARYKDSTLPETADP